jgi:hypothetical protein
MNRLDAARPAPLKLTLKKETLRRLTAPELRLAAGGAPTLPPTYTGCPTD